MPEAVSISIGSSKRDWEADVILLGQPVHIKRIGTDGDMEKAAQLFGELDGKVDAFGVGGTDLGFLVDGRWYCREPRRHLGIATDTGPKARELHL